MSKFIELDNGTVININAIAVLEEVPALKDLPRLTPPSKGRRRQTPKQSTPTYRIRIAGIGATSVGLFGAGFSTGTSIFLSGVKEFNRIKKLLLSEES
jgi:hypothetical protein